MGKHLVSDKYPFVGTGAVWTEEGHWSYLKKRLQFWKWRLHRTMGRPILVPRVLPPHNKSKEDTPNERTRLV